MVYSYSSPKPSGVSSRPDNFFSEFVLTSILTFTSSGATLFKPSFKESGTEMVVSFVILLKSTSAVSSLIVSNTSCLPNTSAVSGSTEMDSRVVPSGKEPFSLTAIGTSLLGFTTDTVTSTNSGSIWTFSLLYSRSRTWTFASLVTFSLISPSISRVAFT